MEKEYNFQKLTPINNVDLNIYEEALDFVFKNDDLVNVGISGPYSSGKSSVIETYKKKHPDKKFMHISLAHFSENEIPKEKNKCEDKGIVRENDAGTKGNGKTDKGNEEYSNILEGKILNQLIHQIDSDDISQTNFRIKKKILMKSEKSFP